MQRINLDFGTPNEPQKRATELFKQGKRIVLFVSGRQAGKSHYGARWAVSQIAMNRGKNKLGAVIAPTFRDARVAIRKIKEVLQTDPSLWKKVKYREQPIPSFQFPDGYLLEVHSAHEPDSLRGPTFDFIWYDEVAKGSKESFDIVMPTLLAAQGMFLGTTTPRGRQNWIYSHLYLKGCPPGDRDHDPEVYHPAYGYVMGTTRDNVVNLSMDAVEQIEDQYGRGSQFHLQEIEGEFVAFEGLVYDWDEQRDYIPVDEMPDIRKCSMVVGGIDFGWTDPAVALVAGYKDGVWYAYDLFYQERVEPNDFAMEIANLGERYGVNQWFADSARPDAVADLQSRGIPAVGVNKPKIEERVREMAMFADNNRLKVSHRCPEVRNELQMYQYPPPDKLERDKNRNPLDKANHTMDAFGYLIWSCRWIWRNDARYKMRLDHDPDDPDSEEIILKFRKKQKRKPGGGPAGMYGS